MVNVKMDVFVYFGILFAEVLKFFSAKIYGNHI